MNDRKADVIVIGGGAAGMMAAGTAASQGKSVILIEKNRILGKKLLITGKGRCNITNACEDVETLLENVTVNRTFLYSAFYGFTNEDTIKFFNDLGVETKIERGNRVFPVSDKSKDVVNALAG
ncbi:MAG: NAD(P)/FAD-dependent oxidoreductase, partial [Clostridia bacterium]|nr:NAD(P)/FAD-dependent oxidoreductase [Clostridia bacterium]